MHADERAEVAQQFGVAPEQVERDHLISHLLAFLSRDFSERIQFIGGRTGAHTSSGGPAQRGHRPYRHRRSQGPSGRSGRGAATCIGPNPRQADPGSSVQWCGGYRRGDTAILRSATGMVVRIQLLSARGRVLWPSERRVLEQRYRDAPAAELIVPTLPAFAASKTATWADRRAPRDLWDLRALNRIEAIDAAALGLYRRFGPTNQPPGHYVFGTPPSDAEWQSQLAGQTRLTVGAADALAVVRGAWARVVAAECE